MANFVDQGFSQLWAAVTTHVMKTPEGHRDLCFPGKDNMPLFCDRIVLTNKQI